MSKPEFVRRDNRLTTAPSQAVAELQKNRGGEGIGIGDLACFRGILLIQDGSKPMKLHEMNSSFRLPGSGFDSIIQGEHSYGMDDLDRSEICTKIIIPNRSK